MIPKSCNDDDCILKYNCHRWKGKGELANIRHGEDENGIHYCNYILTDEKLKILKEVTAKRSVL